MLVFVVALYAVLWLPMNAFQLSLNLLCYPTAKYEEFCNDPTLLKLLYIAAHFLTVSNTAINPIIYGFANHRFRVSAIEHVHSCVFIGLSRFI
jgi:phage shock protein PspC (stress-responsive transcriptional regulator)